MRKSKTKRIKELQSALQLYPIMDKLIEETEPLVKGYSNNLVDTHSQAPIKPYPTRLT